MSDLLLGNLMSEIQDLNLNHGAGGVDMSQETFQKIIAIRKTESKLSTEQKRNADRKSIENMKSKIGIDPLDRFPKEIWKMILDELSPKDKAGMFQVHEMFRDLMKNTMISDVLFPQLVGMKVSLEDQQRRPLLQYLYPTLRVVCKSLRDAVDNYYERNLLNFLHLQLQEYPEFFFIPSIKVRLPGYTLKRHVIQNYFGEPITKQPMRVYCRSLELSFMTPLTIGENLRESFAKFKNDITSFLKVVGNQIWRLELFFHDIVELEGFVATIPQFYSAIHEWLTVMPNLKWLDIVVTATGEGCFASQSSNNTAQFLQASPPPTLENLERIDFRLQTRNPEVIQMCEAILRANRHIKILKLGGEDEYFLQQTSQVLIQSLNLDGLVIGETYSHLRGLKLSNVEPATNFQWNLKAMHLNVNSKNTPINDVFQFLEKFPTLERLSLCIDNNHHIGNGIQFLRLPNLVYFEMKLPEQEFKWTGKYHFIFSLQFLLFCSKLKTIKWDNACKDRKSLRQHMDTHYNPNKMVSFEGGWVNPILFGKSNIWDVFPCLERVAIRLFEKLENRSGYSFHMYDYSHRRLEYSEVRSG